MAKPEVTPTVVTMLDGRVVTFPGKRTLKKEASIDRETGTVKIRLDFINGESRLFTLPQKLMLDFAAHGGLQKYGDSTASSADVDKAVEAVDDVNEVIQSGNWNAVRDITAGSASGGSILAQALVIVSGQTLDVVRVYLATLDGKTKTALSVSAEVAPQIKKLNDEKEARAAARGKAAPLIDITATLAGLKLAGAAPVASVFAAGDAAAANSGAMADEGVQASDTAEPVSKGKKSK